MSNLKPFRLGPLQLRIMKILWDRGEASVSGVQETLNAQSDFAYTTVATMLRKMEERGLVKHRIEGRTFIYRAAIAEEAVARGMADDLVERLFEGSLSDMVAHLLTSREISREELTRLERLIAEHKKPK
jgi:BlaI family transcriptional regulator, penicillinase repressor